MFLNLKKNKINYVDSLIYNISQGDLTQTADLEQTKNVALLTNINNLIKKFRGLIAQIMTMNDKTIKYTSGLKNDSENIKSFSKENSITINSISRDMDKMTEAAKETADYSNEIIETAQNIAEKSETIKKMQYKNMETVAASYDNLEILINKIEKTAKSNINTNKKIKSLEEKIQLIQNIADQVSKISESTNLLALNASIEAARAGEYGKGFSVVADEIRKLAENSTIQSKQIEGIVNGINQEIIDLTSNIESEISEVKDYIQVSKNTKQHLNDLKSETKNSFDAFIEIDKHIEKQVDKVNKIGEAIKDVHSTLRDISVATTEIAATSEEQYKITENTFDKLSHLTNMNEDIKKYLDSFIKNYKIDKETQRYIDNGINTLKEIANIPDLKSMEYSKATPILKELIEKYSYFELLALMQKDGLRKAITLDYTEEEVYVNFSHRPYFKEGISGKDFISKPYISVDTNNYCIAMSVPVKDAKGEIIGIIMADLKL
ncbi:MAG: methyl-accepting chemotaxis protein [Bacillota bacterium]|nr:methyl-accepting chemotaxis protein [Bacillota bacterium]